MDCPTRIDMLFTWREPDPAMRIPLGANDQFTQYRTIIVRGIGHLIPIPAGMVRMRLTAKMNAGTGLDTDRFGAAQTARSTCIFLISAMARAGDKPLGQTLAQFMIVWQR